MIVTSDDILRTRLLRNFHAFVKHFWQYISPLPLDDAWYVKALCYHLQCVVLDCDERVDWAENGVNLLINIPPRPVSSDALINCEGKGLVPLSDIEVGDKVLTHKGRYRKVTAVHQQGVLPVLRLHSRSGRQVDAAADHPFYTPDGWVNIGELQPEDVVGIVPPRGNSGLEFPAEIARLLGYLTGDGQCGPTANVTAGDDVALKDIIYCIEACGFDWSMHDYRIGKTGTSVRRIGIKSGENGASVKRWLERYKIYGKNSYTKHVPERVMQANDDAVANFLAAYWACDGYVSTKGVKRDGSARTDLEIGCDSVSEELMRQVQMLLTRLGINSRLRKKVANIKTKKQGDKYVSWSLTLCTQDDCWKFAQRIKMYHSKADKLKNAYTRRFDFDRAIWGDPVESVVKAGYKECMCLTVHEDESFVANGFAVHNTGKSKILAVMFLAWAWAVDPRLRFVTASYSKEFAGRDAKETRTLMETAEYRRLFPHARLKSGQNLAHRYYTTAGGYRVTMSVESGTTGEGGDIQIFDDPHDVSDSVSKRSRDYAIYYYQKIFFNRSEVPDKAKRIVCGQRVHAADLSATLIQSKSPKYIHLVFPEEYDPRVSKATPLFTDPRRKEGDLLRPRRMGQKEIDELKGPTGLGRKTYAAVYQQAPMDDEGNMFLRRWFDDKILTHRPAEIANWARVFDLACTEKDIKSPDPDWTASTLGGSNQQYPFVIANVNRIRAEQPEVDRYILRTAVEDFARFQRNIPYHFEAVAGFKAVVQHIAFDVMRGKVARPMYIPKGFDKKARATPMQVCAEGGGVWMVEGAWIADFLEELCVYGGVDERGNEYSEYSTSHDDMVDSAASCYNLLHGGGGQHKASTRPEATMLGQQSLLGANKPKSSLYRRTLDGHR